MLFRSSFPAADDLFRVSLAVFMSFTACGNDAAEENRVKTYLINNYWSSYVGGTYNIVEFYDFKEDGTYTCIIDYDVLPDTVGGGTYKINTRNSTIEFGTSSGSGYEYTYIIESDGLRLFYGNQEFDRTEK